MLNMLKDQGTSYLMWQEIFDNGAQILPDSVIDVWKANPGKAEGMKSYGWQDEMARESYIYIYIYIYIHMITSRSLGLSRHS